MVEFQTLVEEIQASWFGDLALLLLPLSTGFSDEIDENFITPASSSAKTWKNNCVKLTPKGQRTKLIDKFFNAGLSQKSAIVSSNNFKLADNSMLNLDLGPHA